MAGYKLKPKQIKSWSNSRWNDYALCPAKAKYKHLDKLPEPKSPQMQRGIDIAQKEEDYFKGKLRTVPKEIGKYIATLFRVAKKQPDLVVEENWGFDRDWNVVDYFDWNNCWLRIKVDVGWGSNGTVVHLRDNKTGKFSPEYNVDQYMEQLHLYAAGAAARFPHAEEFHVALWFTDADIQYPDVPLVITRKEALALQKRFTKQVQPMFNDTRFDPTPNNKCRWCHYRKTNGGPCKY